MKPTNKELAKALERMADRADRMRRYIYGDIGKGGMKALDAMENAIDEAYALLARAKEARQ